MQENLSMSSMPLSKKIVPLALDLTLHKYQAQVDQSKARFIYLMCGRQWGKSILGAWKGVGAIRQPRSMVWYLNNQLKQAKDTIWAKMLQILDPCKDHFRPVESTLSINFNNGSIYSLKHAKDPDCKRGPSLKFLHIDEAQDFDGEDFITVFRPLLAAHQAPCLISGTKKQGSWFMKEWLAAEKGEIENAAAFWFPSTSNPTIPASEWDAIKRDLTRRGRLDIWENEYICDPHNGENLNFEIKYMEFNRIKHICAPFQFPPNWRHFVALDWGIANLHPAVCLWAALAPSGRVYIYDEYEVIGAGAQQLVKGTMEHGEGRRIETYILSEDCWKQESDNKTIASKLVDFGFRPFVKAKRENKAFSGADTVKQYLNPVSGEPLLQIFPNCTRLISELETLKWGDKIGDDRTDALRYLLVFLATLDIRPRPDEKIFKPVEINLWDRFKPQGDSLTINSETGYFT